MSQTDFRILGMCVVKNEADIIEECLLSAQKWCDRIFILDNGSNDGTWEIVQKMRNECIVPWKQDARPFRDPLRGLLFNAFHDEVRPNDWWCRLDADEFYIDEPRKFLSGISRFHRVVWGLAIEYYLTQEDVERIDFSEPLQRYCPNCDTTAPPILKSASFDITRGINGLKIVHGQFT